MSVDFGAVNPVIKNLTFSNFKISFNGVTVYAVGALIENCVFGGNVARGRRGCASRVPNMAPTASWPRMTAPMSFQVESR